MPHTNSILPLVGAVNSISTGWLRGSSRRMLRLGNSTAVPHVLSVVRTKVRRVGVPARTVTRAAVAAAAGD